MENGRLIVLSREELFSQACALSLLFRQRGFEPTDRVLTLLPTGKVFIVTLLGTWLSRGALIPVATPSTGISREAYAKKIDSIIKATQPKLIVADKRCASALTVLNSDIQIIYDDRVMATFVGDPCPVWEPEPDDIAHIQFTSGSTQAPRAAVILHKHLSANIHSIGEAAQISSQDRTVSWLPVYHDMGFIGQVLVPMFYGLEILLIPTEIFARNPALWLRAISDFRATLSAAPAFAYELLAARIPNHRLIGIDLSCWRYA